MALTQNILVATDFSPAAHYGLTKAAELAREVTAKVTLCHVQDPNHVHGLTTSATEEGRKLDEQGIKDSLHTSLREVLEKYFADVEHTKTTLIISDDVAQGICHYAKKEDVELIVLSTHGRTGLAHLLIGSVAEKVVRHAPCPVLTVRSPVD